jgi:hypothetical protein
MSQNLDKNKICESIRKARAQDLLYVTVSPTDKDSKKNAFTEIDKFIGKGSCEVKVVRR